MLIYTVFKNSTYKQYNMVFVFVWFISVTTAMSRPTHVTENHTVSFFLHDWVILYISLLSWLSGKESTSQFKSCVLDLWVGVSMEKEMATDSSIIAWEIPWTDESGRL